MSEVNSIKKGVWLPHLLDDKAPSTAHNRTEASSMGMTDLQLCPDISPGPVQPDNGTIRGVGHKTVLLPLR